MGSYALEIYLLPCHRCNSEQGQSLPSFINFLLIDVVYMGCSGLQLIYTYIYLGCTPSKGFQKLLGAANAKIRVWRW